MTFDQQLKTLLIRKPMRQTELAAILGLSKQGLYQKMKNCTFNENEIKKIEELFNVKYRRITCGYFETSDGELLKWTED